MGTSLECDNRSCGGELSEAWAPGPASMARGFGTSRPFSAMIFPYVRGVVTVSTPASRGLSASSLALDAQHAWDRSCFTASHPSARSSSELRRRFRRVRGPVPGTSAEIGGQQQAWPPPSLCLGLRGSSERCRQSAPRVLLSVERM